MTLLTFVDPSALTAFCSRETNTKTFLWAQRGGGPLQERADYRLTVWYLFGCSTAIKPLVYVSAKTDTAYRFLKTLSTGQLINVCSLLDSLVNPSWLLRRNYWLMCSIARSYKNPVPSRMHVIVAAPFSVEIFDVFRCEILDIQLTASVRHEHPRGVSRYALETDEGGFQIWVLEKGTGWYTHAVFVIWHESWHAWVCLCW